MKKLLKITLISLIAFSLNACEITRENGGFRIRKDQRSPGVIASDALITSTINARYVKDRTVSVIDIDIDTYEGNVTLTGNVKSRRAQSHAIGIARSTKGVKSVNPNLIIVD